MTTLTDAEAEMIRADLVAIIQRTVNVPILHVIPKVEKLAAQAKRANELEAECESWKAVAQQIKTDWIPANKQLAERAESAERRLSVAVGALESIAAKELQEMIKERGRKDFRP